MDNYELVTWKIYGVKPLMTNKPGDVIKQPDEEESPEPKNSPVKKKQTRFKEAKAKVYLTEEGHPCIPTQMFWASLVLACPNHKIGETATSTILPPAVEVGEEEFLLYDPKTLDAKKPRILKANDWVVDTRMVTNKVRSVIIGVMVSRPMWKSWGGFLVLEVDRDVIPQEYTHVITKMLNVAGKRGVGSGRLHRTKGDSGTWVGIRMGKFRAELKT